MWKPHLPKPNVWHHWVFPDFVVQFARLSDIWVPSAESTSSKSWDISVWISSVGRATYKPYSYSTSMAKKQLQKKREIQHMFVCALYLANHGLIACTKHRLPQQLLSWESIRRQRRLTNGGFWRAAESNFCWHFQDGRGEKKGSNTEGQR